MRGKAKFIWICLIPLVLVASSIPASAADRCVLAELFVTTS